jgi:hypothetical protein
MSNIEVNPEVVINNLLEINKQLTLQNAMLRSVLQGSLSSDVEGVSMELPEVEEE